MSKILCISHSSLNAGAEKAFAEMVKALYASENHVICVFPAEGTLIKACQPYIKSYTIIPLQWWFGYKLNFVKKLNLVRKILISAWNIRKYIREVNADKVIVNSIAIPGAAIGAKFAGVKIYWFLHELGDDGFSLIFGEKFSKKMIGLLSDYVLCNSKYTLTHYSRFINRKKLALAYQSVDIIAKKPDKDISFITFGLVGRISRQKGQEEAIQAISKLSGKNIRLILIGSDKSKYADQLKQLVEEKNLTGKVIFTGNTIEIENQYAQLDALISCSRNEAFGRTTIEGMKCGLPVIVPDAFGHKELVEDGINGLYYQIGNADDLADKLSLLLDENLRIKLGKNGKIWSENQFNTRQFAWMLGNIIN